MTTHRSPRVTIKQNGSTVPKGSRWSSRRKIDGTFYVREDGTVGFGKTYGEHSYNYRPVRADSVDRIKKNGARRAPVVPAGDPDPKK
jgi:hypothetical protein